MKAFYFEAKKSSVASKDGDPKQPTTTENQQLKPVYFPAPKRSGCGMKIDREALVGLQTTFYQLHRHRKIDGDSNREMENERQVISCSPHINTPRREVCLLQKLPLQYPVTSYPDTIGPEDKKHLTRTTFSPQYLFPPNIFSQKIPATSSPT